MTSFTSAKRRAEEFDAALRTGSRGAASPELGPLLDIVGALRTQEAPTPRADFSADLRERLLAEAAEVLVPTTPLRLAPRTRSKRERRLTVAASAFALIGGSVGIAAAAQQSAPGDPLYPLKRGIENVQRSTQRTDATQGTAYLDQASDRLSEARALSRREAPSEEIAASLARFTTQAMTGSDLLLDAYAEDQDAAHVEAVRDFATAALEALTDLSSVAPADLSDELAQAGFVLQRIDTAAQEACSSCSDLPALQVPVGMRQTAEIQRVMQQVRLRRVSNDHDPAAVPLSSIAPPTPGSPQTDTGSDPGSLPSVPVAEGPRALPEDPSDLIGTVDGATGGLVGTAQDGVGSTVDGVTGTVKDGVGGLKDGVGGLKDGVGSATGGTLP